MYINCKGIQFPGHDATCTRRAIKITRSCMISQMTTYHLLHPLMDFYRVCKHLFLQKYIHSAIICAKTLFMMRHSIYPLPPGSAVLQLIVARQQYDQWDTTKLYFFSLALIQHTGVSKCIISSGPLLWLPGFGRCRLNFNFLHIHSNDYRKSKFLINTRQDMYMYTCTIASCNILNEVHNDL